MRSGLRARRRRNQGPLTSDQVAVALGKAWDAAYDLYQGGTMLKHTGPTSTASGVLLLALEEYGKIGWLYLALMLPVDDEEGWGFFWDGYYSHRLKSEVAQELNLGRSDLLPAITRFLRHDMFSFSATSYVLDRAKQAVLYSDYDRKRREFRGPRDYPTDNKGLLEVVENLVIYMAENERAGVFDSGVVAAFRELNLLAGSEEGLRAKLLTVFYAAVPRTAPGLAEPGGIAAAEAEVRGAYAEAERMITRWRELGDALTHG